MLLRRLGLRVTSTDKKGETQLEALYSAGRILFFGQGKPMPAVNKRDDIVRDDAKADVFGIEDDKYFDVLPSKNK